MFLYTYTGAVALNYIFDLSIRGQESKWHTELVDIMVIYIREWFDWHTDMENVIYKMYFNYWFKNGRFGLGLFDPALYTPYAGGEPDSVAVRFGPWKQWSKGNDVGLSKFEIDVSECIYQHSIAQGTSDRIEQSVTLFNQTNSDLTNHKMPKTRIRQWYLKWNWRELDRYKKDRNLN